jgi:hypothetical protein
MVAGRRTLAASAAGGEAHQCDRQEYGLVRLFQINDLSELVKPVRWMSAFS